MREVWRVKSDTNMAGNYRIVVATTSTLSRRCANNVVVSATGKQLHIWEIAHNPSFIEEKISTTSVNTRATRKDVTLTKLEGTISDFDISCDSRLIVITSTCGKCAVWDRREWRLAVCQSLYQETSCKISLTGEYIALGGSIYTIHMSPVLLKPKADYKGHAAFIKDSSLCALTGWSSGIVVIANLQPRPGIVATIDFDLASLEIPPCDCSFKLGACSSKPGAVIVLCLSYDTRVIVASVSKASIFSSFKPHKHITAGIIIDKKDVLADSAKCALSPSTINMDAFLLRNKTLHSSIVTQLSIASSVPHVIPIRVGLVMAAFIKNENFLSALHHTKIPNDILQTILEFVLGHEIPVPGVIVPVDMVKDTLPPIQTPHKMLPSQKYKNVSYPKVFSEARARSTSLNAGLRIIAHR